MISEFIPGYAITSDGDVFNIKTEHKLKPQKRRKNAEYLSVHIKGKNYDIHKLVAKAFVKNPHGYSEVRHLDSDPTNNHFKNLAWGTHKENIQDALKRGSHTSQTSDKFKKQKNEVARPSKVKRKSKSGIKGIQKFWSKRKDGYKFRVYLNTETFGPNYLGTFETLEEAQEVYSQAHFNLYGVYPDGR